MSVLAVLLLMGCALFAACQSGPRDPAITCTPEEEGK